MGAGESLYVLGINAYDHDVSACLARDGRIVVAISKERITRVKHDTGFHREVVRYCLQEAGIELDTVDLVVMNSYVLPVPDLEARVLQEHRPLQLDRSEREQAEASPLFLGAPPRVVVCSHHLAHAYSAFAVSPFSEGAVMVVDGVGSYRRDVLDAVPPAFEAHPLARESESYYRFHGRRLETVEKVWMGPSAGMLGDEFFFMDGLGALYSRVSSYVFGNWNRCGEVMGLAPYGRLGGKPMAWLEDGRLEVPDWGAEMRHPYLGRKDEDWQASEHRPAWEDLCRRVQEDTEQVLVERARRLHERTGSKNLCIAGGVALNCVANARILEETPFENVFIQPAAGDDGIAIGCAMYGTHAIRKRARSFTMTTAYLGREYGDDEVERAVRAPSARLVAKLNRPDDVVEATADLLARGRVIGWFQGRSEFGPRALGNRSILADPRDPDMKDRVNAKVKHRQGFRPFAPVVMAERAEEIFEGEAESPFMLLVKRVRPEARSKVPATLHVDDTARVQTLRREHNPRLYALLEAFDRRTGVPVLLNTSFNDRGEPIVETPEDAVTCFLGTQLDALVVHDHVLEKRHLHRALFPFFRRFADLRRTLGSKRLLEGVASQVLE